MRCDRLFECIDIPVGNDPEAWGERAEAAAVFGIGGAGDSGDGSPVEIVRAYYNFRLSLWNVPMYIAPAPCRFNSGLDRLGPRIHWQHRFLIGITRQFSTEANVRLIIESP
ncbi:hypothetical protein D3C84_1096470 [compost metagenome]